MTASFTSISHANLRRVLNGTPKTPTDQLLISAAQAELANRTYAKHPASQTERAAPSTILANLLAR